MDTRDLAASGFTRTIFSLEDVFARQAVLLEKYRSIEGIPTDFDLHTAETQVWVKDFLWRVTEELAEAGEETRDETLRDEEFSDALHFLVELMLLVGMGPGDLATREVQDVFKEAPEVYAEVSQASMFWDVVYNLGLAGNCLKNKRWKQTQTFTDIVKFNGYLIEAFYSLMMVFHFHGLSWEQTLMMYESKSQINAFRQRSGY